MELRQALESDDVADIRAKTEALQEASHKLAEAVYASAQQAQTASSQSGGGNGAAGAPFLTPRVSYSVATYSSVGPATTTRAGRNTLSPSL